MDIIHGEKHQGYISVNYKKIVRIRMLDRKLIGRGKIAEIISDGQFAYKTYPKDFPTSWIQYEVDIQNEVYNKTNLNVLSFLYLEDRREVKMKLISGITLADRMRKLKYKQGLEDMINLQVETYTYENLDLPSVYDTYKEQIIHSDLKDEIKEKALDVLLKIPPVKKLCHFDFHLENIMYDGQKYIIIDWVNAKLGNPIMDIARSFIIFKQYAKRLANKYLRLMTNKMNIDINEVYDAIPLMAALRMLENDDKAFNEELEEMILKNL